MIGLIDTCDVFTRNARGRHTVLAQAALPCRMAHVSRQPAATGGQRAELSAIRNMIWAANDYVMPENAQVEVEGVRWNPVPGTFGAYSGPSGALMYRRADVVRATDG